MSKRALILEALIDGKPHRYGEILRKTKTSDATLSKHLSRLVGCVLEKRVDLISGEYPSRSLLDCARKSRDSEKILGLFQKIKKS